MTFRLVGSTGCDKHGREILHLRIFKIRQISSSKLMVYYSKTFAFDVSLENVTYARAPLTDAGFVRSWKLNLCLTTRAEDSPAAPDLNKIHRGER
jgi:hypothetical protein